MTTAPKYQRPEDGKQSAPEQISNTEGGRHSSLHSSAIKNNLCWLCFTYAARRSLTYPFNPVTLGNWQLTWSGQITNQHSDPAAVLVTSAQGWGRTAVPRRIYQAQGWQRDPGATRVVGLSSGTDPGAACGKPRTIRGRPVPAGTFRGSPVRLVAPG